MAKETAAVKLARIEELLKAMDGKFDLLNKGLSEKVDKLIPKVEEHEKHITVMHRDRFWLASVAAVVGAGASTLWQKYLK